MPLSGPTSSQLPGRVSPPRLAQDWLVEQAGVEPLVPHETDTIHDHPDRPPARLIEAAMGGDQEFESRLLQRGVRCEPDFRGRIPSMAVGDFANANPAPPL